MKRLVIVVVVLIVGLAALAYPTVSNYLAAKNGSAAIQTYADTVGRLGPAEIEALRAAAEEYNQSLTGQPVHDPFLEGSGMAMADNYTQVLNVAGIMGYLEIPRIGVYLPIYHGTSETVLRKGAGHLEGSTLPIGGPTRHTVITGHTGLSHAKLLTDLAELREGDQFYLHVLGEVLAYQVDQIRVVSPQLTDDLGRIEGKDYATLLTCTPYGINSHRLLVRGERVEYRPEVHDAIKTLPSSIDRMVWTAAAATAAAMLGLIVVVLLVRRRREKKYDPRRAASPPPRWAEADE